MSKIVRCELPDGVYRFEPFTVKDYRDMLLIRNDLDNYEYTKKLQIIDEMLELYFPDIPKKWRPYVFVKVFTTSIGKTKLQLIYECTECKKTIPLLLNLDQEPLVNPSIVINGVVINFDIPDNIIDINEQLVIDNIISIEYEGQEYDWNVLPSHNKAQVLSMIEYDTLEELVQKLHPIFFKINIKCSCGVPDKHIIYQSILPLFEVLIHKDEVYTFYQILHQLNKSNYSISDVMNLMPVERSIILSIIEKDKKK